jgi:hypothetical protein
MAYLRLFSFKKFDERLCPNASARFIHSIAFTSLLTTPKPLK